MSQAFKDWSRKDLIENGKEGKVYRVERVEAGILKESALKIVEIPQDNNEIRQLAQSGMDHLAIHNLLKQRADKVKEEIRMMDLLKNCPNTVTVEEFKEETKPDGIGWIISIRMEMLKNLKDFPVEDMTLEQGINLGVDLSSALMACQDHNIVHRNISPENVYIDKDGNFKLGGFSLATQIGSIQSIQELKDGFRFRAPEEQFKSKVSFSSDIYALGVLMYYFFNCGRCPYEPKYPLPCGSADIDKAWKKRFRENFYPNPMNADEELAKIIQKACANNPDSRYDCVSELQDKLLEYREKNDLDWNKEDRTIPRDDFFFYGERKLDRHSEKVYRDAVLKVFQEYGPTILDRPNDFLHQMENRLEDNERERRFIITGCDAGLLRIFRKINSTNAGSTDQIYKEATDYLREECFVGKALAERLATGFIGGIKQYYLNQEGSNNLKSNGMGEATGSSYLSQGNAFFYGNGCEQDYQEALRYYEVAAGNEKNAEAQIRIGAMYLNGTGVQKDCRLAAAWFLQAFKQNDPRAGEMLRKCYEQLDTPGPDSEDAVSIYRMGIDSGDVLARYYLGKNYLLDDRQSDKREEAVSHLKSAANQGLAEAQFLLGKSYHFGIGTPKSNHEAVKYYRMAADQGLKDAQFSLGVCYERGYGVQKNRQEAAQWYNKAANQGDGRALLNLGICYAEGQGVQKDAKHAIDFYQKASECGCAEAFAEIGMCYYYGFGITQNYEEALKYYLMGAEQQDPRAQYWAGVCFENGDGTEKDIGNAIKHYRKSADQGYEIAQYTLGTCLEFGKGIRKNKEKAFQWYYLAAKQGLAMAQFQVGKCYEQGNGTNRNTEQAVKWYRRAADQGLTQAKVELGLCYSEGKGVQKDEYQAFSCFKSAAEQRNNEAEYDLGLAYMNGYGTPRDEREAVYWLRKAADHGHDGAQYYLGVCYDRGIGVKKSSEDAVKWFRISSDNGNLRATKALKVHV